jgi:hypothetical protein
MATFGRGLATAAVRPIRLERQHSEWGFSLFRIPGYFNQDVHIFLRRFVTRTERVHVPAPRPIHSLQFVALPRFHDGQEAFAWRQGVLHTNHTLRPWVPPALRFADEVSRLPVDVLLSQSQFEELLSPRRRLRNLRFIECFNHDLRSE